MAFFNRILIAILFIPLLFISLNGLSQSADIDQIRNGAATAPLNPADWVNGNAGPSNAHYAEGYSIPYRMKIAGLSGGPNTIHELIIEWDTKDQNGHAIDYITHYNNMNNPAGSHPVTFGHASEGINPILGTAFSGNPSLFSIPAPASTGSEVTGQPTLSFNNLPTSGYTNNADINKMAIWGGTITELTYLTQQAPDATTGSTKTSLRIRFKSTNGSTALIAWGGHIAAEYDWGAGRGATGVSGSPYHTRLISLDGGGGNQDRSLKASAVIIPPPVCGISAAQLACPETPSLTFTAEGSSTGLNISYVWTLTNGTTSAGARVDGSATGYSVVVKPVGAAFLPGGTFNLSLRVNKVGAESRTCVITPAGTIQNVVAGASANPTLVDLTSLAHSSTLTASIATGSSDMNEANYDYAWTIVTAGAAGVLTNANQKVATYTAGASDNAPVQFKVVATQKSGAMCKDDAVVSIDFRGSAPCDVSAQAAVCQGTLTTHNGSPSPKPGTATYAWSLQGYQGSGNTTSQLVGTNGGTQIQVNATQSYRIVLTQTYENIAFNATCFEDVVVVPTPSVTTKYNPPSCSEKVFSVEVTNPVNGYTYSIDQPGNNSTFSSITPSAGSPNVKFENLINGDGYTVTVTTNVANCTASSSCATNPPQVTAREASIPTVSEATQKPITTEESARPARQPESVSIELASNSKVSASPNPYVDVVRFNFISGVSGIGSLKLFNGIGQQVGIVYEGYIKSNTPITKNYVVPGQMRGTLFYVFKVGDQSVTGKLLQLR